MTSAFDEGAVVDLVRDFCRCRGADFNTRFRTVGNLDAAFDVLVLKGPDLRWRGITARNSDGDFPNSSALTATAPAERVVFAEAVRAYDRRNAMRLTGYARRWFLSHVIVSAQHLARFSRAIGLARDAGLGYLVPANRDVLIVPRPTLRCLDRPGVLHDDSGRMAAEWSDGSGFYFLRGTSFPERVYFDVISGALSLQEVAALGGADQRSIALSYMGFEQLVVKSRARRLDVGVKGTTLYRLPLPARIVRDRIRGYGGYDYFIHMRDASHPEREFIEWVDPAVGRLGNAELCQAHAFGITLEQWLSIEQEG